MGKVKDLHIDCTPEECAVKQPQTCYMLADSDEEPREPGELVDGGDRDPQFDIDRE